MTRLPPEVSCYLFSLFIKHLKACVLVALCAWQMTWCHFAERHSGLIAKIDLMIGHIISLSVRHKFLVMLATVGLVVAGIYNLLHLPIDAVPDITNNQVQVVTVSPSLAPQEVEQLITYPVEVAVANIPDVVEIRSVSRFGLSVVTIVFEDHVPVLDARQYVKEQLALAAEQIPQGLGTPELLPITTGLGEIYQYVLKVAPGYEDQYDPMRLRTIQDWIVKRQLAGTPGIIEVSSFGGYLKQYEVALDPGHMQRLGVTIGEVYEALARNNQNSGGSYIEKTHRAWYIRTEGIVQSLEDIGAIVVARRAGVPVLIRDVGEVRFGHAKRFGAMTMDGKGEVVGGITLMLKGSNSYEAIAEVKKRIDRIRKSLPPGIDIYPYLDRAKLIDNTIATVRANLLEGGIIVIVVLLLLLGDLRGGLIVASVIPLAMLFAIILMNRFGIMANLMSMGAIDFGIVVDGAVIVVEGVMHALFAHYVGQQLTQRQMDQLVIDAAAKLFRSAVFGVGIILIVFVPIMTLQGVEGKMFRPMAMTFSFAVLGAMILSLTYVPALSAWVLPKRVRARATFSDRLIGWLRRSYTPVLLGALRHPVWVLAIAIGLFVAALGTFMRMGAEFIPTLEEGDLAMQMAISPGSSLQQSIRTATRAEQILLEQFPEVRHVVSKIGTAEVPTDPMAIETADIMILLKDKEEWTTAHTREALVEKMKAALSVIPGASFDFTQPIQLRFNELMTGAKTDIAVKIFGEDIGMLKQLADRAAAIIGQIRGAGDVRVEQTEGLPQLVVQYDRAQIARYGLDIATLNQVIRAAFAGEVAGVVFEGERKFDLVLRLASQYRQSLELDNLYVALPQGGQIPMSELAQLHYSEGPMQISREQAQRRIVIGVNVRNRDVASLVADIERALDSKLHLPPGYYITYGGQFENLQAAQARLSIAVPVALALIFILLYFAFGKAKYALMIFTAVPFSAIGGVWALWLRGMPFSISAGVGFIALFGVAVLNGIVLIAHFNRLRYERDIQDLREVIRIGATERLRPVIMTATVAALGFLPMALSTSNGAEVQRPLATVVIGGLLTATLLTLIVMPVLYWLVNRRLDRSRLSSAAVSVFVLGWSLAAIPVQAQQVGWPQADTLITHALVHHPLAQTAALEVERASLGMALAQKMPPLSVSLSVGQLDSPTWSDFELVAMQPLPPNGLRRARQKLAQAQWMRRQAEQAFTYHQLVYGVAMAWLNYEQALRRYRLWQQWQIYTRAYLQRMETAVQAGEYGPLELSLAQQLMAEVGRRSAQAAQQLSEATATLRRQAYYEGPLPQPDTQVHLLPLPVLRDTPSVWLAPLKAQLIEAEEQVQVVSSALKPSWSVGIGQRRQGPFFPLLNARVSVQLPLWRKPLEAAVDQAQVAQLVVQQALQARRQELTQWQSQLEAQAYTLHQYLTEWGLALPKQAQALRQLADQQLAAGEVDYATWYQSLRQALQMELDYLELIGNYNSTVLEWRYYLGQ